MTLFSDQTFTWWNSLAIDIAAFLVGGVCIAALTYIIVNLVVQHPVKKYGIISRYEISLLKILATFIVLALTLIANSEITNLTLFGLVSRLLISIAAILISASIINTYLNIYYPYFLEKRLRYLRYSPRVSPVSKQPMRLLPEEEEDNYLTKEMIAEEASRLIDYDVWKDDISGFVHIEKYDGRLMALVCPECNFHTFKLVHEEFIESHGIERQPVLIKHYTCNYCHYKGKKEITFKNSRETDLVAKTA